MTDERAGSSQDRLIVEPLTDLSESGRSRQPSAELDELSIGRGVWQLGLAPLELRPHRSRHVGGRALCFESVRIGRRPALLMLTGPELSVRVNGAPAPRLSALELRDQVRVNGVMLHVTRFREPRLGPPAPEHVGRECAVCGVPIHAETRVLVCECGEAVHLEPESVPEKDRLECALLSGCQSCGQPLSLESGLVYRPEL